MCGFSMVSLILAPSVIAMLFKLMPKSSQYFSNMRQDFQPEMSLSLNFGRPSRQTNRKPHMIAVMRRPALSW